MQKSPIGRMGSALFWVALIIIMAAPLVVAATSPLLAGREAVYIIGGLAGVVALSLLILQPLLAAGYLPGIRMTQARRWHRRMGFALVVAVTLHVAGLYLTSPPDMIDALLLVAPTLYSVFGVVGMWALLIIVILLAARSPMKLRIDTWRMLHNALAVVVVVASVVHALMIEGTMGYLSKLVLSIGVLVATAVVTVHFRWSNRLKRR